MKCWKNETIITVHTALNVFFSCTRHENVTLLKKVEVTVCKHQYQRHLTCVYDKRILFSITV